MSLQYVSKQALKTFFKENLGLFQSQTKYLLNLKSIKERDQVAVKMTLDLINLCVLMDPPQVN